MNQKRHRQRILLAGATGYIGRAVARALCDRGYSVVAPVRAIPAAGTITAEALKDCDLRVADISDGESPGEDFAAESFDAVISCIASRSGVAQDAWRVDYQANTELLNMARTSGAKRFMLLSAICVQRTRLAFQQAKLAFEAELQRSGLDYTIIRPTAFFKSLSGQIGRVKQGKPFLVFGDGRLTACKPIGEADLAHFMVDSLEDDQARRRILPIGGPGPAITPRAQGDLLFQLTGMPPRFRQVPVAMFKVAAAVLTASGKVFPPLAAKAELARIGHYYATESMLLWDREAQAYDADATPEYGQQTLEDFYTRVLREGLAGQSLGEHKLY